MNCMVPVTGFLYALWLWSAMLLCACLGHINDQRPSSNAATNHQFTRRLGTVCEGGWVEGLRMAWVVGGRGAAWRLND